MRLSRSASIHDLRRQHSARRDDQSLLLERTSNITLDSERAPTWERAATATRSPSESAAMSRTELGCQERAGVSQMTGAAWPL
jgi:hypothetical protein